MEWGGVGWDGMGWGGTGRDGNQLEPIGEGERGEGNSMSSLSVVSPSAGNDSISKQLNTCTGTDTT